MKLINLLIASLLDSASAYTFFSNGRPNNTYFLGKIAVLNKGSQKCDCEVFCAETDKCKFFSVDASSVCYAWKDALKSPSSEWDTNPNVDTYT